MNVEQLHKIIRAELEQCGLRRSDRHRGDREVRRHGAPTDAAAGHVHRVGEQGDVRGLQAATWLAMAVTIMV